MSDDLLTAGVELKGYVTTLLGNIEKDVDGQFDKWCAPVTGYLSHLVGCYEGAQNDQVTTLREQEDERQRALQRALFVLNFLAIGATAWLGVALEKVVGPRLFFEYEQTALTLPTNWLRKIPKEFDGALFGNLGKDITNALVGVLNEKLAQPAEVAAIDGTAVAKSPDMNRFGYNLNLEIKKQKDAVKAVIDSTIENINRSTTFSSSISKKLKTLNPHLERMSYPNIIGAGHDFINSIFEEQRKKWAASYFFYGYNPPPNTNWARVQSQLEKMLWAVWVAQQNFGPARAMPQGGAFGMALADLYYLKGAQGNLLGTTGGIASTIKDSPITLRLFERFNAPVQDILLNGPPTTYATCTAQADKLRIWANTVDTNEIRSMLKGVKRDLGTVDKIFSQ
jgi:hypothetical protein